MPLKLWLLLLLMPLLSDDDDEEELVRIEFMAALVASTIMRSTMSRSRFSSSSSSSVAMLVEVAAVELPFLRMDLRGAKKLSLLKRLDAFFFVVIVVAAGGAVADDDAFLDAPTPVVVTKLAPFLANWFNGEISFIIILFVSVLWLGLGLWVHFCDDIS